MIKNGLKWNFCLGIMILFIALPAVSATFNANLRPYAGIDVTNIRGSVALYDTAGVRNHLDYMGNTGGVFFGLGADFFPHLWAGIEAHGDLSSARSPTRNIIASGATTTARLRERRSYGLSFVPGIYIKQFMLFGRVGISRSEFEYKQASPPVGSTSTIDYTRVGSTIFGGGVQLNISKLWHVRAEYDRQIYKHFTTFANRIRPLVASRYRLGVVLDLY